jgi:toxin ParE1/3/4
MEIRLAKGVQDEFDEACSWYDDTQREMVGPFKAETLRILDEVINHPLRWPKVTPRIRRRLYHRRFPYAMLYRVHRDYILIVAIMHTSRRSGYWRSRVTKK